MIRQTVIAEAVDGDPPLPAELRYNRNDPFAIEIEFDNGDATVAWVFARDLLAESLRTGTAGIGDVGLTVQGDWLLMRLATDLDSAVFSLPRSAAALFLRRTYGAVPRGREVVDVDALLTELLNEEMP